MIQIQKNISPPAKKIHPIEEALILLRDQGEIGDSIVLPSEMASGARLYYSRVATDQKVFLVKPEGNDGSVRVWLIAAQPAPPPVTLVRDIISPISPQTISNSINMPADLAALAFPDENLADLKTRLLTELTTLRSMAVGQIPMTDEQRAMLTTLEGQVAQQWFTS